MYVKRHEYFRWNRKTAGLTVLYMAVIPGALYALAKATEVSHILYNALLRAFNTCSELAKVVGKATGLARL